MEKEHAAFDGEFWEEPDEIDFTDEFTRATGVVRQDDDGGDGEDRRPAPASERKLRRSRERKRDLGRGR